MPQIKDIAITKVIAENSDFLVMQNATTGETYKITKADLLAGFTSTPTPTPALPTYIFLPLLETSGSVAVDTSGNNKNGVYVGASLNANGVILDGSSRISLTNSHNALNSLSIGLEFKTSQNANQGLWEFRASQDLSSGVFTPSLMMNSNGNLAIYGYPSGSSYTSQSFKDNAWHKSIVSMSGSSIKIFIDKVKILDINANPITGFTGFFSIGSTRANGNFAGQLKNFRVWDSLLTDTQSVELS